MPLIRQRVRSFRQHLFFFRLFYECPRLRPRLATNTSVTLSKPDHPRCFTGGDLVETCRLNASRRAFRPLSSRSERKARRAKSLRVAVILANQSTPDIIGFTKYINLSPQREGLSSFCLFCLQKSPKVAKMGTKCLKNRILVPNFTYKLTQKAGPNSLFC